MIRAALFNATDNEHLEVLEWYKPGIRFNKRHVKTILEFAQYHAERGKTVDITIETDNKITLKMVLFYLDNNRVQIIYRTNLRISKGEQQ